MTKINRIASWINNSPKAQKLCRNINKNPGFYTVAASCVLSGILRPSLIATIPFKDDKNRKYSVASSLTGAATEVASSALIFMPLTGALKKASDQLYKAKGTVFHNSPEVCRAFKCMSNRLVKFGMFLPLALARFGMVSPLVDFMFGKEKKPEERKA